jgi:3-deoxy-D-manno-octulosonate 8-phosphate phosphatase KdsC-like HAD superfamily phosphatase
MADLELSLTNQQIAFDRGIAERRTAIEKEEQEIAVLKARVANIDAEIAKESAKAVAIATSALKKDMTHEHQLVVNGLQNQIALAAQQNTSLNEANTKLAEQLIGLQKALDSAKEQVQSIAVKALESASGQTALAKVQDVLREGNGQARGNKS